MTKETPFGKIQITPTAIASLVTHITIQTYGVVGMSMPTYAGQLAATLIRDPRRGVSVMIHEDDSLTIDVYIIVHYGTNLASVANSLIRSIRYRVETQTSLVVQQVNVHIQGLKTTEQPF